MSHISKELISKAAEFFRVVGDETRMKILCTIAGGEGYPFGDLFFICFLQDFRQVVPKSVPAGLENKRTFFADSDRL